MKTPVVLLFIACIVATSAKPPNGAPEQDRKIEKKRHEGNDENRDLTRFLRMLLRKDVLCKDEDEYCRDDCCEGYVCRPAERIMPIWKCIECSEESEDCSDDDDCCDRFECKGADGSKKCLKK